MAFACMLAAMLAWQLALPSGSSHASAPTSDPEVTAQTDASVPAREVAMIGSSPSEAANETWGIGEVGAQSRPCFAIVRYSSESGWSLAPGPLEANGHALVGFEPDQPQSHGSLPVSPLAGQVTAGGSGVLAGTLNPKGECAGGGQQVVLVRNPHHGGAETAFQETSVEPVAEEGEGALLKPGEVLFGSERTPMIAALEESDGKAGALVVPVDEAGSHVEEAVLHWNGSEWSREPIEAPQASKEGVKVLAIAASSPANAWLLARYAGSTSVALFHRRLGGPHGAQWLPVSPKPGEGAGAPLTDDQGEAIAEPSTIRTQVLTVTEQGVWIDGERSTGSTQLTMFFKLTGEPKGESYSGEVLASWCNALQGPACNHTLAQALPRGATRSFAWANAATPFGERVITGLAEGVSLRLEGDEFVRVLALGGSETDDPGSTLGAAFASAHEGWLGSVSLPVHLTLNPAPSHLSPVAVPFRHALTAIAPQPGAPSGSTSSEAIAVGDEGEVARYIPGEGWQPESLLGAGGRIQTPHLRAVTWPTPMRAYAVGETGQMWLWRGETGRWERDPAKPLNFRGNLLGVAFDPSEPSRGYAVGQQGVLLRYGKSWTQEEDLPSEVAGASFTSIAFAGSEAIVAYRQPHPQSSSSPASYTGGLLVNNGSGWHVDQGAASALAGAVPWAVAALPDGGAAVSGETSVRTPVVLERNGFGSAWEATASPYPGTSAPGSLALFREGEALRAIGSGAIPDTFQVDFFEPPAPNGLPPDVIGAYPVAGGSVLRQTAAGWSDEQHERDEVGEPPPGEWPAYDVPYQADPTSAVLVSENGREGWAVGGVIDSVAHGANETADISRYQIEGAPSANFGESPIASDPSDATFAIAGDAQCEASCADLANARIGPDVWLSSALTQAGRIAGVRAFLYLGPRVTSGRTTSGHAAHVDYEREFARYAELLAASPLPAFALVTPTDLGKTELQSNFDECLFEQAFQGFSQPFGDREPAPGVETFAGDHSAESCETTGAQSGYYAFDSSGPSGTVRVIALDDSAEVGPTQRSWLAEQLISARHGEVPAIVLGDADLHAQIAEHDASAEAVAQILLGSETPATERASASAYFFDAPEENIAQPLRVGGESIPTFGSGTLGYGNAIKAQDQEFIGHAGFLLGQVDVQARNPVNDRAPVSARLIPNIGELALEAQDGVLLRRSQSAMFAALARRPRAGGRASTEGGINEAATYVPIPANCIGTRCAEGIFPEYTFTSSRPEIGEFVTPNLDSAEPQAVLLGENGQPVADPQSGLFCAYNAGTTVVTISAGGLSASLTVTVQPGSVRRPCGTTPLNGLHSQQAAPATPPPPPAPAPVPTSGPTPASAAPSIALPTAPAPLPPAPTPRPPAPRPATPLGFFLPAPLHQPLLAFVPPPVPTPARPTPPSGTSAVTSPIEVAQHEEDVEEAPDSVSNAAVAYRARDYEPAPAYIIGILIIAAAAGAGARRRPRRGRRELGIVTVSSSQERRRRRR
jgi:hypothetical protein